MPIGISPFLSVIRLSVPQSAPHPTSEFQDFFSPDELTHPRVSRQTLSILKATRARPPDGDRPLKIQSHLTVQADPPASDPAPDNTTGNMRQHDALAVAQNGGLSGHEADDGEIDADQDVDLEDDLMDKISSSPSIEDGGSTFALPLVASSSLRSIQPSAALGSPTVSSDIDDPGSSSPYLESPEYLPLESYPADTDQREVARSLFSSNPRRHHHHHSCHCEDEDARSNELRSPPTDPDLYDVNDEHIPDLLSELASPVMDQLYSLDPRPGNSDDEDDLPVPYESDDDDSDDDDDDDRGPFLPPTSRFVDSGWGGECLQDTEDIDFDFVYALHTFVATVEGQANATKGDTMVLLDDSNSYWWLVRVVKDSSIGRQRWPGRNMDQRLLTPPQDTYQQNTLKRPPRGWLG
jgi:hypothetical protein